MAFDLLDDPELQLLAAATARPPNDAHRTVIAAATMPDTIDWNRFLQLVDRHRVAPLVFDAVVDIRAALPASVFACLRARAMRDRAQALRLVGVLASVTTAFNDAGIDVVSVKGPVLAQIAFRDTTMRQSRDIDIVIRPDMIEPALSALKSIDCHPDAGTDLSDPNRRAALMRLTKDVSLIHRPSGTVIELHWRSNTNPLLLPSEILRSRQKVMLGTVAATTFGPDDLLLYLSIHGVKHYWFRLKWLSDIYALLAAKEPKDIAAFYERGVRYKLRIPVGQALLMVSIVYGLPLPGAVRRHAERPWRTRCLIRMALHYVAMTRESDARWYTPYAMILGQLGFRSEPTYIGREIAGYLVDLPILIRMGGTRLGYAVAILGRPLFWVTRRIMDARSISHRRQ